jgi:non-canonical purine NTP pyrophosphatase (RdgB/HAM1 family)
VVSYFITGNKGKFNEVKDIIPTIEQINLDLPEVQELDPKVVIEEKLKAAQKLREGEFVCEDTSLYIDCLNGFPGPLIKWFLKSLNETEIHELVEKYNNSKVTAKTVVGYTDGNNIKFFEGILEGTIVKPRGDGGFGWDKMFQPVGHEKTLGEMSIQEKNQISMRKIAFEELRDYLNKVIS